MKVGDGLPSTIQALSRGCRYPWQPSPGTFKLRNSVKII